MSMKFKKGDFICYFHSGLKWFGHIDEASEEEYTITWFSHIESNNKFEYHENGYKNQKWNRVSRSFDSINNNSKLMGKLAKLLYSSD